MIFGIGFLPDSPRWYDIQVPSILVLSLNRHPTRLVNQGRYSEALAVISALEDKPHTHEDVQRTFLAIREAALSEQTVSEDGESNNKFQLGELLHGGRPQNLRRATLGIVIQAFQQITGINLIT
jgi:hypothetical protein